MSSRRRRRRLAGLCATSNERQLAKPGIIRAVDCWKLVENDGPTFASRRDTIQNPLCGRDVCALRSAKNRPERIRRGFLQQTVDFRV
jgi:hypothetical protein